MFTRERTGGQIFLFSQVSWSRSDSGSQKSAAAPWSSCLSDNSWIVWVETWKTYSCKSLTNKLQINWTRERFCWGDLKGVARQKPRSECSLYSHPFDQWPWPKNCRNSQWRNSKWRTVQISRLTKRVGVGLVWQDPSPTHHNGAEHFYFSGRKFWRQV